MKAAPASGHFPCVGGPMSGRLIAPGPGRNVEFAIRTRAGIRRVLYRYATGACGEESWTYLKYCRCR